MDDPKHFRLRSIVSRGFTPKEITRVEDQVRIRAAKVVDRLLEEFPSGSCDFVEEVAAMLPLQIICDMMGIPEEDHKQIFQWTNIILGVGDPEFGSSIDDLISCGMQIFQYAQTLGEDRLAHPKDDVTSAMMHAEVDGERLTPQEFGSFFILLEVAGEGDGFTWRRDNPYIAETTWPKLPPQVPCHQSRFHHCVPYPLAPVPWWCLMNTVKKLRQQ